MGGLVAATVTQQVEQHHAVPGRRECLRDPAVQIRVDEEPVEIDDEVSALAVGVVDESVALEGEVVGSGSHQ